MFPDKDVPPEQRVLKGFNWRFMSRPLKKDDVFRNVDEKMYEQSKEQSREQIQKPTEKPVIVPETMPAKVAPKLLDAKDPKVK